MNLRYISLWINHSYYTGIDDRFGNKFNYNTRFVNNYISRQVRNNKVVTRGQNMISVQLSKRVDADHVELQSDGKIISVILRTTDQEIVTYSKMTKPEQCEFYLQKLELGYELAHSVCDFDITSLYAIHAQFRAFDYKNEWPFKKKTIKNYGIIVSLDCSFTFADFNLFLSVYDVKTKELIAQKNIFRTFPDEIFFTKSLRKALFDTEKLIILDFLGQPECSFNYKDLAKGDIIVNILNENDEKYQYNEVNKLEFEWIKQ